MSFRYEDRLHDPKLFPGYSSGSSPSTSGRQPNNRMERSGLSVEGEEGEEQQQEAFSGKYIDPRLTERHKKVQFFAASQRITHVVLSITPSAIHCAEIVPPAELSFDLASLQHLLRDRAPKDIDDMVREGKPSVLFQFATHVARLVRLEYTNGGLKYAIVGAFSEPPHETCGWPLDVPSYLDDDDLEDLLVDAGQEDEPEVKLESPVGEAAELDVSPVDKEVEVENIAAIEEEAQPPPPVSEIIASPRPPTPPAPSIPAPSPPVREEAPLPFTEPCPMHPVLCSTAVNTEVNCCCCVGMRSCKCTHQVVTLKGSDITLWANFSRLEEAATLCDPNDRSEDSAARAAKATEDISALPIPSTIEAAPLLRLCLDHACALQVRNALRLVAVDQIDPSLMCEVVLSADKVTEILRQACTAATASNGDHHSLDNTDSGDDASGGLLRHYVVSSSNELCIDLMLHPALRRLCFDYICDSSMLDLFLSRKSKLIKLIVK